jgi:hypothetical protein
LWINADFSNVKEDTTIEQLPAEPDSWLQDPSRLHFVAVTIDPTGSITRTNELQNPPGFSVFLFFWEQMLLINLYCNELRLFWDFPAPTNWYDSPFEDISVILMQLRYFQ